MLHAPADHAQPRDECQGPRHPGNAAIGIQSGNVAKHMHPRTDEIQYIIEGSGATWLGSERKEFKGTAHGGTIVASGPVQAIAIKIPPEPKDDTTFLD